MRNFRIEIKEILQKYIDIEAQSAEEALVLVQNQYKREDIVLSADDCTYTDIDIQASILTSNKLIKLLSEVSPKQIEANLLIGALNATHNISMQNGIIFDEGIDDKLIQWTVEEFVNTYPNKWKVFEPEALGI